MPNMQLKTAFTLIELLVVIAIISLLITILLPSLRKAQDLAKSTVCKSELDQIGIALMMYTVDYNGSYPIGNEVGSGSWIVDPMDGISKLMGAVPMGVNPPRPAYYTGTRLAPYLENNLKVFLCPSDEDSKNGWASYGYNGAYLGGHTGGGGGTKATGSPAKVDQIANPSGTVAIVEGLPDDIQPPGGNSSGGGYPWVWDPYSPNWNHDDGMNVLLCDGHVQWFSIDDPNLNATDDRMWKRY